MSTNYSDLLVKEWEFRIANARSAASIFVGVFTFLAGANFLALWRGSLNTTQGAPIVVPAALFIGLNLFGIVAINKTRTYVDYVRTRAATIVEYLGNTCQGRDQNAPKIEPPVPIKFVSWLVRVGQLWLGIFCLCWIAMARYK